MGTGEKNTWKRYTMERIKKYIGRRIVDGDELGEHITKSGFEIALKELKIMEHPDYMEHEQKLYRSCRGRSDKYARSNRKIKRMYGCV